MQPHSVQWVLFSFQDMSEPEGYNDDSENHNTTANTTEENFNDENDVDDETMSGKHKTTHTCLQQCFRLTQLCQYHGNKK